MPGQNRPEGPELRRQALAAAGACRTAAEALDAATGVDQLLAARVDRVAVRADLDVKLGLGGAGPELVAAGAAHVRRPVLGMDVGLHRPFDSSRRLPNHSRNLVHQVRGLPNRAGGGCLARTIAIQSSSGIVPSIRCASAVMTGASSPPRSRAWASRRTVSSASTAWPIRSGISAAGTPCASSSPALRLRELGASAVATRSPVPARPTKVR